MDNWLVVWNLFVIFPWIGNLFVIFHSLPEGNGCNDG